MRLVEEFVLELLACLVESEVDGSGEGTAVRTARARAQARARARATTGSFQWRCFNLKATHPTGANMMLLTHSDQQMQMLVADFEQNK